MLSKRYNLANPSEVRELLSSCQKTKLMLALVYKINSLCGEAGYLLNKSQSARDAEWKASLFSEFAAKKATRIRLNGKLKQLLKLNGLTMTRRMGGRISYITARVPKRGQPRPSLGITGISQKALYVFSDLYSEEYLMSIIINQAMFNEDAT